MNGTETSFTPGAGLVGGALIGLASAALLLANGKVAGISGILGRSFLAVRDDRAWRLTFLAGLPLGAWLATRATADALGFAITSDPLVLVAGGLFVGVGTQLGNGCTSGHGVCGIARGSIRSLVATVTFMLAAALTVYVTRHFLGVAS
jgi:uncharacterized membrane protein YedE/YeeE